MKTLLALSLSFLGLIAARADIPAPKPTSITVTNISAFPQYKFSYRAGDPKAATKAIVDGQSFTALTNVTLLVQSGEEPSQTWETVKYDWRGAKVNFKVGGVKLEGRQISVAYQKSGGDATPTKKSAASGWPSVPLFALAGMSACALVIVRRRRKGS